MINRSIGIFDSGVGGLTVLCELRKKLPQENFIYFGDTARVPYGGKSSSSVLQYSVEASHFLRNKGIKLLVIACNTATAFALDYLNRELDIPVIGVIEPGAIAGVKASKNKSIGVIGTKGTVRSKEYNKILKRIDPEIIVESKACPLFAPIVEEGLVGTEISQEVIEHYLKDFKSGSADTLILGCTHYPVMKEEIQKVLGPNITLINPAYETAKKVRQVILEQKIETDHKSSGSVQYYCSDDKESFYEVGSRIIKINPAEVKEVELKKILLK